jgi:hypothetical protein
MASGIVSKRTSKLNLSRRQVALFQKIILVGSQMAGIIIDSGDSAMLPKGAAKCAQKWGDLMVQLANTLL